MDNLRATFRILKGFEKCLPHDEKEKAQQSAAQRIFEQQAYEKMPYILEMYGFIKEIANEEVDYNKIVELCQFIVAEQNK